MLAIVIPYYKNMFFKQTLQSLASQTDKRFKVYIGDDASPVSPFSLLKEFEGKFDFEYHYFQDNLGSKSLVQQWQRCIALTKAEEWLMVLGDDDTLEFNCIEKWYQNRAEIQAVGSTVVRFESKVIDGEDNPLSGVYSHPKVEFASDFLIRKLKGGTRSSLSEYVFERKVFDGIGIKDFPLAWNSDLLAVIECSDSKPIYTINNAIVNFRLSGQNITSQTDNLIVKERAAFRFYYYLLMNHRTSFSRELINMIFNKLEKRVLEDKKNVSHIIKLMYLYLRYFKGSRFLLFIYKFIKNCI